ncbi:MAG: hypothetical protein AAF639_47505 [Chloroflexota bacterium]
MTTDDTIIYKLTDYGEIHIGTIGGDHYIYPPGRRFKQTVVDSIGRIAFSDTPASVLDEPIPIAGKVFRKTIHDERELGVFTTEGDIRSHGLFEGGSLGWVDPDGVVIQGGLILGEEEVGRVEGPLQEAAAAALLLLFLPDDAEANRILSRRN